MAEETLPKPADPSPSTEVVAAEAAAETKREEDVKKDEEVTPPAAAAEEEKAPAEEAAEEALEAAVEEAEVTQSASFKEESNVVADLEDPEKKALDELKQLIQTAIANNEFTPPPPPPPPPAAAAAAEETPAKDEEKAEEKTEESKKEEEAAPVVEEAPKTEEPKAEEAPPAAEEPPKAGELKAEEAAPVTEEPLKTAAPAEPAQPSEAEEKVVVIEEGDGAKIVEVIDETIVVPEVTEETPAAEAEAPAGASAEPPEEVFIWGIPLLGDEKSDTVLLKFLRARDFKVKDALAMIKNAVIWRKQFGTDILLEEDLEVPELEKAVFYHGLDKEGHPVCYNVFGEFQDKEFYGKAFGDEEKREKFLRWRIQYLEKGIRQLLDFTPGAVSTMVQVTDLKNTPGPGKKELRVATKKALALLQDNYPEFVAKQIFINVPWWYLAYNRVMSPFFTQRTKSKFVFAGPSKSAETLFKYIAPEQVPVQYGGLSKDSDPDFTTTDAVTEVTIKPASKHIIEISASEGSLLVWELRVLGWEVSYGAEFVPTAEDGYTVIVQKARKFLPTDEPYVKNSFKVGEPGKVLLTIDNASSKKKKLLYRSKEKSSAESN